MGHTKQHNSWLYRKLGKLEQIRTIFLSNGNPLIADPHKRTLILLESTRKGKKTEVRLKAQINNANSNFKYAWM